jgi:quinohemoprotein amine dehydrogenase
VRVTPTWSMARTGGASFPKQLAQFEAWTFHNGKDGKPDTADDLKIDMVPAAWSLEEYTATYDDDDLKYVGAVDKATGLFTPAIEGPNPQRSGERNNVGDVWVVASVEAPAAAGTTTLRGRAHLLVTVPLYQRWNPTVIP